MNICVVFGVILDEVKYNFILNSKNNSFAELKIKLQNDSVINVIAYNQTADYCYRRLNKNDRIFVQGRVQTNLIVLAEKIIRLEGGVKNGEGEKQRKTKK